MQNFESYYYVIWATAFVTAIVSASIGFLGGTMLIAVMAQYLKMEVLIPLHGLIQLMSNGSRAWFLRRAIHRQITTQMIIGIVIGSIVGALYIKPVDERIYNLILGIFILTITFVPKFKSAFSFKGKWTALGFVASSIGLYLGAVGVLVGSVLNAEKMEKRAHISTQAMTQAVLHFAKVLVFISIGFLITPWLSLLAGTLVMSWVGTWVGTKILDRIPQKLFRQIITTLIVLLALRLIVSSFV